MPPFQILSSLLLTFFITISYGQANVPTGHPTKAPTRCECKSWTGNSSYILDSGKGCKSSFDGRDICETGCSNNECKCVLKENNVICVWSSIVRAGAEATTSALATWLIILIVIGSLCGLCIIVSIIYCICAGALCCAAASKGAV